MGRRFESDPGHFMAYKSKQDQAAACRRHYLLNREKMIARAKAQQAVSRERNRQFVLAYLRTHPCVDCGEDDPVVLEFDHVRGRKVAAVAVLVNDMASLKRIKKEIAKCEVCCANCHRRRTASSRNHYRARAG